MQTRKIKDCNHFPEGSRTRAICDGSADLPEYKINAYRVSWGLPPLTDLPAREQKVYHRYNDLKTSRTPIQTVRRLENQTPKVELGDAIANALKVFGITPDRVSKWIGKPCGCKKRQEKLNKLSRWAKSVFSGDKEDAVSQLDDMINE